MKRLIVMATLLLVVITLSAQAAKQEALESLDTAKALINKGDYVKAQEEMNFAQAKISEIVAEELLKHIPEKPKGFVFDSKETTSLGQAGAIIGSANAVAAVGHYSKDDSSFDVTITMGGALGQAGGLMSGLASMFGGMATGTTQIRVSGYTGTQEFDKSAGTGSLTIKVGNKISVIVTGEDITNPDILKTLAEQVDMALLEKSF
ncbi:MAG: hypothetical protein PHH43_01325 [Candidatus Cloacimonetes bacterium]|nr:hypothetical protein [Candidatus Cloacimonadota bacterium]MDD3234953.1 hypothetical protein [Candidatus Cloacimonadota bacterium]